MNHDHAAAEALLRTGVLVPVRVVEETVTPGPDEGEFVLRIDVSIDDDEIPEEDRAEVVEWGAFGFLFVIGTLSFHDARPRGASEIDYRDDPPRASPRSRRRGRGTTSPAAAAT